MSMMGGGMMTPLGGAKVIQLTSSTDSVIIKDQDGFIVHELKANGEAFHRGGLVK